MTPSKRHHCAKCGRHKGKVVTFRKKSGGICGRKGRPWNMCIGCAREYAAKSGKNLIIDEKGEACLD